MAEPTSSPRLTLTMKLVVVGVLYFAEGIPFGFIITSVNAYLSGRGVPPEQIGILSLLSLPWSLKFFWSPLVDRYGTRATWIVSAQLLMIFCLLWLASLVGGPVTIRFWLLLGILCLGSATQDLAIDAYTIDFLETQELGMANGIRSGSYRFGALAAGSGLLILSDWVGWQPAFVGVAVLFIALAITIIAFRPFRLPRIDGEQVHASESAFAFFLKVLKSHPLSLFLKLLSDPSSWANLFKLPYEAFSPALKGLSRHPSFWAIILFTLLYKAGDAMMGIMVIPFWKSLAFTGTEIGLVSGMLGSAATTLGGLLGGWYTSRVGIATSLWILGLTQALFHLGYWLAALPGMGRLVLFHLPLPFLDLGARVYPIYLASAGKALRWAWATPRSWPS